MTAPAAVCPHCFGDHNGCTIATPRCSAASAVALPPKLAAFALHVLAEMELCNMTADACILLVGNLYWSSIRAELAQQMGGRSVMAEHVAAYADRMRKGESAKAHRFE